MGVKYKRRNKMSVFVCGDTHVPHDITKITVSYWPIQKDLTKDDYLIVAGDFGLLWTDIPDREEKYWTKAIAARRFTTLFIDGNHDNFDRINALPEIDMFGGKVGVVCEGIYHLKRGYVYTICDRTFWCFGGAMSTDRGPHVEGWLPKRELWWPQEIPSKEEMDFGISQLEAHNWYVDRVITHAAPKSIVAFLGYEVRLGDPVAVYLESLKYRIQCKKWHFGHYHVDRVFEGKYMCHYNSEPFWIV